MEEETYYSLANEDYEYLMECFEHGIIRNPMAALSQNTCERYLKHIISEYSPNPTVNILHSHSLRKLVNEIKKTIPDFIMNEDIIYKADGYYFSTRYPGDDCFIANKTDILKCKDALLYTKKITDEYIKNKQKETTSLLDDMNFFDDMPELD